MIHIIFNNLTQYNLLLKIYNRKTDLEEGNGDQADLLIKSLNSKEKHKTTTTHWEQDVKKIQTIFALFEDNERAYDAFIRSFFSLGQIEGTKRLDKVAHEGLWLWALWPFGYQNTNF